MTLKVSEQVPPVGTKLIVETSAGATPNNGVTGAAGTIFQIDVDNTANGADDAFLKIYDNPAPVVGTTAPDFILRVPANQRRGVVVPDGFDFNDLSFAVVTTGGTAGTTSPTNPVVVKMVTT